MAGEQTPAAAKKTAAKKAVAPAPAPSAPAQPQTATAPQPQVATPQPSGAETATPPVDPDEKPALDAEQLADLRQRLDLADDAGAEDILVALLAKGREQAVAEAEADELSDVDNLNVCTDGDVECVMKVRITGLRNGIEWPAVGRPVYLPADEAVQYAALSYVDVIGPLPAPLPAGE